MLLTLSACSGSASLITSKARTQCKRCVSELAQKTRIYLPETIAKGYFISGSSGTIFFFILKSWGLAGLASPQST